MVGFVGSALPDRHRIGRVLERERIPLSQGVVIYFPQQESGSYKGANKDIWNMVDILQRDNYKEMVLIRVVRYMNSAIQSTGISAITKPTGYVLSVCIRDLPKRLSRLGLPC